MRRGCSACCSVLSVAAIFLILYREFGNAHGGAGWPRYLATALRTEAMLALALGRAADAVPVLERYLALRQDADPELA
jgi:Zn-dependent protease